MNVSTRRPLALTRQGLVKSVRIAVVALPSGCVVSVNAKPVSFKKTNAEILAYQECDGEMEESATETT